MYRAQRPAKNDTNFAVGAESLKDEIGDASVYSLIKFFVQKPMTFLPERVTQP
jgi:hypothetical protein